MRDSPLSIHLDSDTVVLRTVGDEEPEPAVLTGSVILDLHERAEIKDVHLTFTGKAKITYIDTSSNYKSHSSEIPLYFDDHSFLPSFDGTTSHTIIQNHHNHHHPSSGTHTPSGDHGHHHLQGGHNSNSSSYSDLSAAHHHHPSSSSSRHPSHGHGHHHSHTLNPGLHSFPFTFTIPGSLPASLRTHTGSSTVTYQIKASCHKSTALSSVFHTGGGKWSTKRPVNLVRGLTPEAVEFTQTLEIENTWPGKIMYNITLPHKAFCAGENIPVALKFTPIAKGVRVTQLVTSVREHLTVATKTGQPHNTQRDVVTKKHTFVPRSTAAAGTLSTTNSRGSTGAHVVSVPPSRSGSHSDLASLATQANRLNLEDHPMTASTGNQTTSTGSSRGRVSLGEPSGTSTPGSGRGGITSASTSGPSSRIGSRSNSPERVYYGRNTHDPEYVGSVDEDGTEDVDVDAVIEIPLPLGMAPSHTIEPLMISHKIKWSAYIRNLDGHTSELRCALPIHILSPQLSEEANLATSGTRTLLFGPSGVLVPAAEGIQQVDLPSYSDHIKDRVANIDGAASVQHTVHASVPTPPSSLGLNVQTPGTGHSSSNNASAGFARSPWASPHISPSDVSPANGREGYFVQPDQTPRPINWADSELLNSLSMSLPAPQPAATTTHSSSQSSSRHVSPTNSRPSSRPNSRPGSRQNSRPSSRASSPVRGESTNTSSVTTEAVTHTAPPLHSNDSNHHPQHAQHPPHPPQPASRSSSGFFKPLRALSSLAPHHHHGHGHSSNSSTPAPSRSNTLTDDHHGSTHHAGTKSSHSTGNLASFFHVRPSGSRRGSSHNLPAPDHGSLSHIGGTGDVAQQTIAALEAHQRQVERDAEMGHGGSSHMPRQGRKDKGKSTGFHFGGSGSGAGSGGKGKKKAMFAVHDDDESQHDGDHHHDDSHDDHHHHDGSASGSGTHTPALHHEEEEDRSGIRYLSQVPSYDIASRGFLGGGLPPLSIHKGLPSYVESEHLSRPGTPGTPNHPSLMASTVMPSFGSAANAAAAVNIPGGPEAVGGSSGIAGGGVSPGRLAEAIEQQRRLDEEINQSRNRAGSTNSSSTN